MLINRCIYGRYKMLQTALFHPFTSSIFVDDEAQQNNKNNQQVVTLANLEVTTTEGEKDNDEMMELARGHKGDFHCKRQSPSFNIAFCAKKRHHALVLT